MEKLHGIGNKTNPITWKQVALQNRFKTRNKKIIFFLKLHGIGNKTNRTTWKQVPPQNVFN